MRSPKISLLFWKFTFTLVPENFKPLIDTSLAPLNTLTVIADRFPKQKIEGFFFERLLKNRSHVTSQERFTVLPLGGTTRTDVRATISP